MHITVHGCRGLLGRAGITSITRIIQSMPRIAAHHHNHPLPHSLHKHITSWANMVTRKASHAGSWYTDKGQLLSQQLDAWLEAVPAFTTPIGSASSQRGQVSIPTPNARAIIAPYAP